MTLDVQRVLDEAPFSRFQQLIFALCFAIVLLDGFDTGAVGFIAPSLLGEWHLDRPALAPVLTAAVFGLVAGALFAGPFADRIGRKRVLAASVTLFGLASLSCAYASSLGQLVLFRFVIGIGLGAAMPNAVTLMSEYCPARRRALLTNAMFCGFPLGAALGGFLAAWMIPSWGWRSVPMLGGIAPLLLTVLIVLILPESVRYMIARQHPAERIRATLARISTQVGDATSFSLTEPSRSAGRGGVRLVLSREYLLGGAMLWIAYFMGLLIFYAMINWLPILLRESGLSARDATLVSALFPLGGVGAIFCGWLMDRGNAHRIVAVFYALTAVGVYAMGQTAGHVGALIVVVFVAGTLMNTAQVSLPSLAAAFYPTQGRATGVAWMMGIGRFGGILGSFLVAELARRQLSLGEMFGVLAIPGVLAALALRVDVSASPRGKLSVESGQA